jgi:hypothetical protein
MNLIYTNTLKIDFNVKIKKQKNDIYTSKFPPKISIGDFVNKIIKFSKTSESTFILALIYLDRFCKLVLPRVRDFSGISKRSFDPKGNLNF